MDRPESLKGLFQGMIPDQCEIVQGTVVSTAPLEIQIAGDEKLLIHTTSVIIPRHLTDYQVPVSIPESGGHSQYSGSGVHSHDVEMTVHNALQVGESVHLLVVQQGKKFFALDRV